MTHKSHFYLLVNMNVFWQVFPVSQRHSDITPRVDMQDGIFPDHWRPVGATESASTTWGPFVFDDNSWCDHLKGAHLLNWCFLLTWIEVYKAEFPKALTIKTFSKYRVQLPSVVLIFEFKTSKPSNIWNWDSNEVYHKRAQQWDMMIFFI